MAIAVIGGLIVSTVLSLVVVPCFYIIADKASGWVRSRLPRRTAPAPAPLQQEP
ncbi:Multidrug resistance protein MdtB [compost metagenome]